MAGERPLLGRAAELTEVEAALAAVRAGEGRLLLLSGEPGIGKTRLAEEAAARARGAGLQVAWGRCSELGDTPAYWPWTQALRHLLSRQPGLAAQASASRRRALALLVPELFPEDAAGAQAAAADARFRLFAELLATLREATSAAPLLIVLDDLHVADRPSLQLLQLLSRELQSLPLMLVGTHREAEARVRPEVGSVLAGVAREGARLSLRRLTDPEVGELMERRTGQRPPAAIRERVFRASEGNPLCLDEVLRLLIARGGFDSAERVTGLLSDVMREAIARNVGLLASPERALLELAATIGRDASLHLLAAAAGKSVPQLEDALAPALCAGLGTLVQEGPEGAVFRFHHILIQESVYGALEATRRAALHLAVAQALEGLCVGRLDGHAAGLARHLLAAGPGPQRARGVEFALRAGRAAMRRLAFEDAAAQFEQALAAGDCEGVARDSAYGALLLELAEAQVRSGESSRGRATALRAAELAREVRDAGLLARAALQFGSELSIGTVEPALVGLLRDGLAAVGEGDAGLRAQLEARLAAALTPGPDPAYTLALARTAVDRARTVGDPRVLLRTLHFARAAFLPADDWDARRAMDAELVPLAESLGEPVLALVARGRLAYMLLERQDRAGAEAEIAAYEAIAERFRQPHYRWMARLHRASLAILTGRFPDAEALIDEAQALGERADDPAVPFTVGFFRANLLTAQRRPREALVVLAGLAPMVRGQPSGSLMLAVISARLHVHAGDFDEGRRLLCQVDLDQIPDNFAGWSCGADTIAAVGTERDAQRVYRLLLARADHCELIGSLAKTCEGSVRRALGQLAVRLGMPSEARAHLELAVEQNRRLGARPWEAVSQVELAAVLGSSDDPADRARAGALVAAARETAVALGMSTLVARCDALPVGTGGPGVGTLAAGGAETWLVREGELWRLCHRGAVHHLKDSRGMGWLARLLSEPGRELHVLELVGGGAEARDAGDAGEVLDARALAAYRERAAALREELEEAEDWADSGRAARRRKELEALEAELSRALGLGSRARRTGGAAERARVNAQKRITDAVKRIAAVCPELGRYLEATVRTGTFCSFQPLPR